MAERDAFGRDPNENTLEGLGSFGDDPVIAADREPVIAPGPPTDLAPDEARAAPERPRPPAASRSPAVPPTFTVPPGAVRTAAKVIRVFVIVIVLFTVLSVGVALLATSSDVSIDPPTVEIPRPSVPTPPIPTPAAPDAARPAIPTPAEPAAPTPATRSEETPSPGASAAPPRGLAPRSMLQRRNLAPALARMRSAGLGRLRTLRVAPERVDAQLLTRGGRLRSVQARFDGEFRVLSTSGPGFGHLDTVPFARVNPAAPARLARSAAGRLRRPVSQVDYVVLLAGFGPLADWSVIMRGGAQFLGDARGRIERRIN